jgi:hypothetical protein
LVPKQLAGEKRIQYYQLMFLEAYANGGRWGYYWWPGVDAETRLKATAPEQLREHIRFIARYRDYYEQTSTENALAILYLNSGMRRRPESHVKFLALAQALAEAGYQYDVIFGGDGIYSSDDLDMERLQQYKALLVPESENLTDVQVEKLARFEKECDGEHILFAPREAGSRAKQGINQDEEMLLNYWRDYRENDRERIAACVAQYESACIRSSNPLENVIRYIKEETRILHLINYNYDSDRDYVSPIESLSVSVPWEGPKAPGLSWLSLDGEQQLPCRLEEGRLDFEIPRLELYGLAILREGRRKTTLD